MSIADHRRVSGGTVAESSRESISLRLGAKDQVRNIARVGFVPAALARLHLRLGSNARADVDCHKPREVALDS
jgi:hypothetical protein